MLGVLIVLIIGGVAGYFSYQAWDPVWGIICAIAALLVSWVVLSLILRRAVMGKQLAIQTIMQEAQNKMNRQMEFFQRRQQSSINAAQKTLETIQGDASRKALAAMDDFKSLYKWNPMLYKQINTMKLQLYYQLKEFKKVDELLASALIFDPQSMGMKLARMYRNKDEKLDRYFIRNRRKFRGDDGAFIACVYAWIKLKQDDAKSALDALLYAKKLSDHQVLVNNIEQLTNGKVKHFSNSGFGDAWYVLFLEEPKVKQQKRFAGRGF